VLEKVANSVFGVSKDMVYEALSKNPVEVANNPRLLLALAIWRPGTAWGILKMYGRILGARAPRNTVTTTIAPTGSISIIAGTSSGIEPYFALVYKRTVSVGEFLEVVRQFRGMLLKSAKRNNVPDSVVKEVFNIVSRRKGSLRWALNEVRDYLIRKGIMNGFLADVERLAKLFATSMDFDVWYHVAHNAAAQLYVDQAISKTVNLPKDAPPETVETVYLAGWLVGLKGVTVYRDESKSVQVITFGSSEKEASKLFWKPVNGNSRRVYRLMLPKRKVSREEVERDPNAAELFGIRGDGETVVVEIDENSTCKTCHI